MSDILVDPVEHRLIADDHPAFVSPLGDRREKANACAVCRRPTYAICVPPLCPRHQDSEAPRPASDAGDVRPSHPERDVTGNTANTKKSPAPGNSRPGH